MKGATLIGPFSQIITMDGLPEAGPINDSQLEIIENGGIIIEDQKISEVIPSDKLQDRLEAFKGNVVSVKESSVLIPGLIDSHTHICYGGERADDYARRLAGESYLEIARKGGGILSTVAKTRAASETELLKLLKQRAHTHLKRGVTTCEIKSGYGLDFDTELKMLRVINSVAKYANNIGLEETPQFPDIISTCLSAHVKPKEFEDHQTYLTYIIDKILPEIKKKNLSKRVDIFIESEAFNDKISTDFTLKAQKMGFTITIHADQFSAGGAKVAAKVNAISADHLEASQAEDLAALKESGTIATVLPGASFGLGIKLAPARKILDAGLTLVIASDWNPGSAPMGDLLIQASILGAAEKLTLSETLSAITNRAAKALQLENCGKIKSGMLADMLVFPFKNYREIFYNQGAVKPSMIWKRGQTVD